MKSYVMLVLTLLSLNVLVFAKPQKGKFFYFAYGSNLLKKRLHINNPSAVFYSPARLDKHRLDFVVEAPLWRGAVATIAEDPDSTVWGGLWTMDLDQMDYLDKQEGVNINMYFPKTVTVSLPDGTQVEARTYQENLNPTKIVNEQLRPMDRRPSFTYLQVIIQGAIECGLPPPYIAYLYTFPPNGKFATRKITHKLGYPFDSSSFVPTGFIEFFH